MISSLSRRHLRSVFERLAVEDSQRFRTFIADHYPEIAAHIHTGTAASIAESAAAALIARGMVSNSLLTSLDGWFGRFNHLADLRVLREELGATPLFTHRDPVTVNAVVDLAVQLKLYEPRPVASLRTNYQIADRVGVDYSRDPVRWLRESAKRANHADTPDLIDAWMAWATAAKPQTFVATPAPPPPRQPDAWEMVQAFLIAAFSVEEMRRLVSGAEELCALRLRLPEGPASALTMATALVDAVRHDRRLLDLLEAMTHERPNRVAEIDAIRRAKR